MANCTVGRAMTVLGERWTFVVLREVFNGVRRFEEMREHTDIPRQVLTNRLASLVKEGILRQVPYRDPGFRSRYEYRLTDKGFDLYPVLVAVLEWGDKYLADPEGSPVQIVHRACENPVRIQLSCSDDHFIDDPRDLAPRPGPGAYPS
jgi:DNA-binding HxlR family transcriptional regulator